VRVSFWVPCRTSARLSFLEPHVLAYLSTYAWYVICSKDSRKDRAQFSVEVISTKKRQHLAIISEFSAFGAFPMGNSAR
jgi:hypothetical protein